MEKLLQFINKTAQKRNHEEDINFLMEEMGEVLQAISKHKRALCPKTVDHLEEELGDLLIMTLFNIYEMNTKNVFAHINSKVKRIKSIRAHE